MKLYREQNIHAKVYIMTPEHPVPDVNHGYVITGSSNLSHSGLEGNLEFNVLLAEPEEHDYALNRFIADGRVGKATIRKVKEAFDKTDDPVAMIAILRKEIARQYLLGPANKPDKDAPPAPREVILSSYLP